MCCRLFIHHILREAKNKNASMELVIQQVGMYRIELGNFTQRGFDSNH